MTIQFRVQSFSWGISKDELHLVDLAAGTYAYLERGAIRCAFKLPQEVVPVLQEIFESLYQEFPHDVPSIDAPIWTLTIDDKTCRRIAVAGEDSVYVQLSGLFDSIKNAAK